MKFYRFIPILFLLVGCDSVIPDLSVHLRVVNQTDLSFEIVSVNVAISESVGGIDYVNVDPGENTAYIKIEEPVFSSLFIEALSSGETYVYDKLANFPHRMKHGCYHSYILVGASDGVLDVRIRQDCSV